MHAIEDEHAYQAALAEADALMEAEAGTPNGERLNAVVTLVEAYERQSWRIPASSG